MSSSSFYERFSCLLDRIFDLGVVPFLGAGVSATARISSHGGSAEPEPFKPTIKAIQARIRTCLQFELNLKSDNSDPEKALANNLCADPETSFSALAEVLGWLVGHNEVLKTIQLASFTRLTPVTAHVGIACLAREGFVPRVITSNWDTCLEKAFIGTFFKDDPRVRDLGWDAFTEKPESIPLTVISDLTGYRHGGGRRLYQDMPILRIIKINGCAGRYVNKTRGETDPDKIHKEAEGIRLNERQLQQFWNHRWAHDLLVDTVRSRCLLFSGFGSDEPQVRHTILQLVEELEERSAGAESQTGSNSMFLQAHEPTLSFNQTQVLRSFYEKACSSPSWPAYAFTGRDRSNFELVSNGVEKLTADLFWLRLFQAVFGRLLQQQVRPKGVLGQWVREVVARAPGKLMTDFLSWYYPPGSTFESLFGRFHRLWEPPATTERALDVFRYLSSQPGPTESSARPLVLSAWLAAMDGRLWSWEPPRSTDDGESELKPFLGAQPYMPLTEEPVLVGGALLALFILLRLANDQQEVLGDVQATDCGLKIEIAGRSFYLVSADGARKAKAPLPLSPPHMKPIQLVLPSLGSLPERSAWRQPQEAGPAEPLDEWIPGRFVRFDARWLLQEWRQENVDDLLTSLQKRAAAYKQPARQVDLIPLVQAQAEGVDHG